MFVGDMKPRQWPQCVGMTGEQAKAIVLKDFPQAQVSILPENSPVTMDLRFDRVRIFVNQQGKVVHAPGTG